MFRDAVSLPPGRCLAAILGFALMVSLMPVTTHAAPPPAGSPDVAKYLPVVPVAGWTPDRSVQKYVGDDLYNYIDGGAEIYQEYGFRQVAFRDYKNAAGKSIQIEVFAMASPESAYGIYSFKTGTKGRKTPIGQVGWLESYYLNFWKGSLLVTLTGQDSSAETSAGLVALAKVVDGAIPAATNAAPALVGRLPKAAQVPGSVKYLLGQVGLSNSYPFFTRNVFGFVEAVRADYTPAERVFLFAYRSAQDATARFADVVKAFQGDARRYTNVKRSASGCELTDDRGKTIVAKAHKAYILVSIGAQDVASANTRLRLLQGQIAR